jgi:4-azaleucine resistance transporter AzlC
VTTAIPKPTRRDEFLGGVKATIPLAVGGVPFGIIFGTLAVTSGISAGGAMGLSAFVFAGSSQFIAVGLVAAGTEMAWIIVTTFVVNARHALYSASLAPYVKRLPHKWLLPLGFMLTDEAFVIAITRYQHHDDSPYKHWYFLGSALFMYVEWQVSTFVGIVAGSTIPDPSRLGLDFAMSVTFLGMLAPTIKTRPILAAVLVASATALLTYSLPNQLYLIVAALAGIVAGLIAENLWGAEQKTMPAPANLEEPLP